MDFKRLRYAILMALATVITLAAVAAVVIVLGYHPQYGIPALGTFLFLCAVAFFYDTYDRR
jgi:hypothetical protein